MEALVMLNDLVDESDPDIALPNIVHAFQVRILLKQEYLKEPKWALWIYVGCLKE